MLWDIRDLTQKEHKTLRVNLEFDHATFVAWSPDSKAFIIHTVRENRIAVYKIEKKKDGHIGSATQVMTFDNVCFSWYFFSLIRHRFYLLRTIYYDSLILGLNGPWFRLPKFA